MAKMFWYIVRDNTHKTFDVLGLLANDDSYNALVVAAQKNGHDVNANSPSYDGISEISLCEEMERDGFLRDRGLLDKMACFTGTYPRLTPYCGQPGSRKPVITGFLDLKTFKRVSTCFEYF